MRLGKVEMEAGQVEGEAGEAVRLGGEELDEGLPLGRFDGGPGLVFVHVGGS
jgi:hypothetical protein